MRGRAAIRSASLLAAVACCAAAAPRGACAQSTQPASRSAPEADPRWLERLPPLDRALLDEHLGFAPPAFTADLTWIGGEPRTWADLRGRVVVVQSWSAATSAGRRPPQRMARLRASFGADDLQILLLHTPDGADKLQALLERKPLDEPVVLDSRGAFCDDLGIYRRPVNLVVDRSGVARYAGLNTRGLGEAVAALVAEPFDAEALPPARPEPEPPPAVEFPTSTDPVGRALDLRGQRAPEFLVSKWITRRPDPADKVVVIDFWATWCRPCIASIPHMNDLARRFADSVCIVGLSDESSSNFEAGMMRRNLSESEFSYALALDSSGRMQKAMRVEAIPYCVVLSSDWIVRWQGHPQRLTAETLGAIVRANAASVRPNAAERPRRWTRG